MKIKAVLEYIIVWGESPQHKPGSSLLLLLYMNENTLIFILYIAKTQKVSKKSSILAQNTLT